MTIAAEVPQGVSVMEVLDHTGDTKIMWSKDNADEVDNARRQFDYLVGTKKFAAFKAVGKDGAQGDKITAFDPNAERLIMVPPLQGG